MAAAIPLEFARSRKRRMSSIRKRTDIRPLAGTSSTAAIDMSGALAAPRKPSINRFNRADSEMSCVRAMAPKRSLVSREIQVKRCVLSLIVK